MNEDEIWGLCKLTLALVLVLGAGVYATNGRPSHRIKREMQRLKDERAPASLLKVTSSTLSRIQQHSPNISTVDLECIGEKKVIRLNSESELMRLVGQNCKSLKGELAIKNITNGFEASVFQRAKSKFSSDYLSLNKGTNAIQVSFLNDGKEQLAAELVVTRK